MATVYLNNKPVDIGNEKLNVIQAAHKGLKLPSLVVVGPLFPRWLTELQ